jgi:hypothetical protein
MIHFAKESNMNNHKTIMSIAIAAAMLAANSSYAASTEQEAVVTAVAVHEVEDIVIAQNSADGATRERKVIVSTGGPLTHSERFSFQGTPGSAEVDVMVSGAVSNAFSRLDRLGLGANTVVKNAPYTAEIINEQVQTLQDGNQIVKRTSQLVFRDSAGRTRSETRNDAGQTRAITIFDPLDKKRISLFPTSKTGVEMKFDAALEGDLEKRIAELRERARTSAKDGTSMVIDRGTPGQEIIIQRSTGQNASGKQEISEEVKVSVVRSSSNGGTSTSTSTNTLGVPLMPPGANGLPTLNISAGQHLNALDPLFASMNDRKWSSAETTRDLGVRDMEGVRAEGKLRSYTIPANEIGNRNPITVTTETWYSPDLQITLYSKRSDPRTGDVIYRVANVKRTEPSISLFTVPDGYKMSASPRVTMVPRAPR